MRNYLLISLLTSLSFTSFSQDRNYLPGRLNLVDGSIVDGKIAWEDHDVFVRSNGIESAYFSEEVQFFEVYDPAYSKPRRFYSLREDPDNDRKYILFEVALETKSQAILFKKEVLELRRSNAPDHLQKGNYVSKQAERVYGTRSERVEKYTYYYSTPKIYLTPFLIAEYAERDQIKILDKTILTRFSGLNTKQFFSRAVDEAYDLHQHQQLSQYLGTLISEPQVLSN